MINLLLWPPLRLRRSYYIHHLMNIFCMLDLIPSNYLSYQSAPPKSQITIKPMPLHHWAGSLLPNMFWFCEKPLPFLQLPAILPCAGSAQNFSRNRNKLLSS